jgi:uncharacterized protein YqhQ
MNAVGRTAQKMVEEVRRLFREIKGILTGEELPTIRFVYQYQLYEHNVKYFYLHCLQQQHHQF